VHEVGLVDGIVEAEYAAPAVTAPAAV